MFLSRLHQIISCYLQKRHQGMIGFVSAVTSVPHLHFGMWSSSISPGGFSSALNTKLYSAKHCGLPSLTSNIRHYSMKRKNYQFPVLLPEDLEENFVRGSGPGGQAVNQTSNCVVLKHIPSGIVIKCHETRSLLENQKIARRRLEEKLDLQLHGEQSYLRQQQLEHRKDKVNKRKKATDKLALKMAFKEGLNDDID